MQVVQFYRRIEQVRQGERHSKQILILFRVVPFIVLLVKLDAY